MEDKEAPEDIPMSAAVHPRAARMSRDPEAVGGETLEETILQAVEKAGCSQDKGKNRQIYGGTLGNIRLDRSTNLLHPLVLHTIDKEPIVEEPMTGFQQKAMTTVQTQDTVIQSGELKAQILME